MISAIIAAGLSSGALAGVDYCLIPVMVSIATRLGIITPPPGMTWIGTPEAIAAALAVYIMGHVVDNMRNPGNAKRAKRLIGGSFAAASLTAMGLATAYRSGLEGYLFTSDAGATSAFDTQSYTGADVAVLASIAGFSLPMAGLGKGVRKLTGKVPYIKSVHVVAASFAVVSSALVSRMPAEVQIALAGAAIAGFAILAVNIFVNARQLGRWFGGEEAPNGQRLAVVSELFFPGIGAALMGRFWQGLPRMALSVVLMLAFLVFGLVIVPIYLRTGLSGALAVSRMSHQVDDNDSPLTDNPTDSLNWQPQATTRSSLRLGAGRLDEEW